MECATIFLQAGKGASNGFRPYAQQRITGEKMRRSLYAEYGRQRKSEGAHSLTHRKLAKFCR